MKTQLGFLFLGLLLFSPINGARELNRKEETLYPFDPMRRSDCGGTLRTDEGTLEFPGVAEEPLVPGETCVWTIHLESTREFRFNFSQFDVNSPNSDCLTGGVRLYSLSNLGYPGDFEGELFCSSRPPNDFGFHLAGNVVVVVVYSSASNSEVGSGFTLTWRGANFDPLLTKHASTFSTAESGLIGYPVVGEYEPNLVATWGLSTEGNSDVEISKVNMEGCPNEDPCTCDALILYEVVSQGVLVETDRFCSNSSTIINRFGISRNFLLAFFSDYHESSGGSGFSALYFPTTGMTDPTTEAETGIPTDWTTDDFTFPQTTESATTPETSPPTELTRPPTTAYPTRYTTPGPEVSECGVVLDRDAGYISYHLYDNYANDERCVWTLQPADAISFYFSVTHYGITDDNDGLLISTVFSDRHGGGYLNDNITNFPVTGVNPGIFLSGNAAILTFHSDSSGVSRGFRIYYEATTQLPELPRFGIIAQTSTEIKHPETGESYLSYTLATFVYAPNFKFDSFGELNFAEYRRKSLDGNCRDRLNVFKFTSLMEWAPYSPSGFMICDNVTQVEFSHPDMFLFIFKASQSVVAEGFELSFSTGRDGSSSVRSA